jgi:membrane protease YdiL (CAAX protease family)
MFFFALLVAVLAPIAEEIFFRGMIFRSLWNGMGLWPAAIVSGVLFGALHIDATTSERLLQVVPLVVLGVSFALLYSWTGTLFATRLRWRHLPTKSTRTSASRWRACSGS